uniref:Uncharacterized protein n=1 Tax=Lepeophtheirus salmonis TaxID=72036 RepID=A0A0K2USX5_LEPSM
MFSLTTLRIVMERFFLRLIFNLLP